MPYICIIVLLNAILVVDGTPLLIASNGSECTVPVSKLTSRQVPYTETYKTRKWGIFYRVKTRVNYRREFFTTWIMEKACCTGYRKKNNNCEPICTDPCIHGQCIGPQTCKCEPGYVPRINSTRSNVCVPICENNCENGFCERPDRCACNRGYQLSIDESNCQPICTQNCEQHHAHCVEPDRCVCDPGYQSIDATTEDTLCTPICEVPCVNGNCTAPDVCTCNDGYEPSSENVFACKPKCVQACRFGTCVAPNTCTCDPGYRTNDENVCEPICSRPCVMGTCIAPETCTCNDGYGLLESSMYVCEPICEKACVNGKCTAPGVCVCNEGYRFDGSEEVERMCKPFCKIPCYPYGDCIAPDTCSCFEGYRVDASAKEIDGSSSTTEELASACVPVCDQSCVNGKCVEPNVCKCDPGYGPSANNSDVCEPVCEAPCEPNSVCTGPNNCTCNFGYRQMENEVRNVCEPICDVHCSPNATCTAPNVCTCDEGYELDDDGRCKPFCSSCHNGTCVAPDVCRCLEGFISTNNTACLPFCENDCENGECVAPNECRCHDGFETKGNNSGCIKPCTKVCKGHGVCVEDEKPCDCSYGWTGWDCDQPAVCILLMDSDDTSLEGITVHNETNSTLIDARHYAPYCYRCNETVSNGSFCFAVTSDDGSPTVGCFVETKSPCYSMYRGNKAAVSTMAGILSVVTILIMAAGTTATYFVIRKQQRRKTCAAIVQSALFQGSIANESLLSEEDASLR